jgi:YgiT-type zinc finger domain-containing protein
MNAQNHFCPICHGGRKQAGLTTFTVELGFGVVVVRNVPAQVCNLCGTDWLEDSVAEKLEQFIEQARQKHPVVEVANWPQENGLPSAYLIDADDYELKQSRIKIL